MALTINGELINTKPFKKIIKGNLYRDMLQPSQQMNRPNIYRYNDGRYVYQAAPDAEEIEVSPINTLLPNPSQWTYQDADGKVYIPLAVQVDTGSITQGEDTNPLLRAANNYMREAAYRAKDGTLALQGKYTMPAIAASVLLPLAGEAFAGSTIAGVPATTWANTAMTAGFAGHGLNHAINEGINGWGDAAMTAMELAPLGRLARPIWNAGKKTLTEIQSLYNNYPIRNYNIDTILKSDFYNKISEQYGKDFADDLAHRITSKEFRDYLFGDNPRRAFKDADRHFEQMQFIKDVENAGGLLGGSGQLARVGTVNRNGLMHDLDFFIPGSMESKSSPVIDALGLNKHNKPLLTVFEPTGTKPKVFNNTMGSVEKGYINLPQERGNIEADMFIRDHMPTKDEAVDIILDAKRQFGRPKDIADIEAFKPYSADNPIIDINTGRGQWNPTLFDEGIFTGERYPFVQSVETYPGSGVRVPVVMNYKGKIRSLANRPSIVNATPQITAENAASITPEQWTAAQDAAIARGDMTEAQRLRDLHFKVSAPNTKAKEAVFNGSLSDKPFYEFNTNFRDAYWGGRDDYTTGAWFGTGDENTLLSFAGDNPNRLKKFYLNFSNPFIKDAGYRRWDKLLPFNMTEEDITIEAAKLREKGFPEYVIEDWKNGLKTTTDNYALKLETTDYDSGIIKNVYENKAHPDSEYGVITDYIASKPNQIKLADAITYDKNGVRIPLGMRDNFKINDIRYGLLPFLGLGAAGTLYRNLK